jgi:hypothetical protein
MIFVENESFYKKKVEGEIEEKEKEQSQDISHTIDQTNPVLSQLYGIDIIEHREQDYGARETEPSVRREEIDENEHDSEGEMKLRRSSRIPQPSTRLKNFITYKVQYSIQDFIFYDTIYLNI